MLRSLIEEFLLFVLPFCLFAGYLVIRRRNPFDVEHWSGHLFWLTVSGLVLGIASSDSEAAVAATAERFGLEPHLAFRCGYDSRHGPKPERGMVDGFCAATGLPAEAVAVVGGSTPDMHMAAAAGGGFRRPVQFSQGFEQDWNRGRRHFF